jgi:hypothetical protein
MIAAVVETFGASASATVSYLVPPQPVLVGAAFAWQGVTGTATSYGLTFPVWFTHLR